jgi:hypothetical protein
MLRRYLRGALAMAPLLVLAVAPTAAPASVHPRAHVTPAARAHHRVGLGKMLATQDGGQIFGFDINQNGNDGVLASAQDFGSNGFKDSMETFDQDSGTITKVFAKYTGSKKQFALDGIFTGDVALVTHYEQIGKSIYYRRAYDLMNPVTGNKFTGSWTDPVRNLDLWGAAENQNTQNAALFGYVPAKDPSQLPKPVLIVSNIAASTSKVFGLDTDLFGGADDVYVGEWFANNKAVLALSPDAGRPQGKQQQFNGLNNGTYGSGAVTGMAVDGTTGFAATATQLNAQVEIYNLANGSGIAEQLPCTTDTDEESAGSNIAVDPVNHLFLVTEYLYCNGSQGSAIIVYDENGNQIEVIPGFTFGIGEPAPAINPGKRMGWALSGAGLSHLQQFFY